MNAGDPNEHGYRTFRLGEFKFSRDEYFVYVTWPTGSHVMSADAFLRALQRDVAWDFFYGIVNFDGVVGTVNHYGTVDLFAGRYNDAYRKAELDHLENFQTAPHPRDVQGDARRLDQRGLRPVRQPDGDRLGVRPQERQTTGRRSRATGSRPSGWSDVPGDEPLRTDDNGYPVNRHFLDVPQDEPEVYAEPGFESEVGAFNLFAYLSRSDVTWNPSVVVGLQGQPVLPDDRGVHPARSSTATTASSGSSSSRDEICWDVEDRDTGRPRAKVVMKPGDVAAMPADIRHQGYSPEALDAAGLGERDPRRCRS